MLCSYFESGNSLPHDSRWNDKIFNSTNNLYCSGLFFVDLRFSSMSSSQSIYIVTPVVPCSILFVPACYSLNYEISLWSVNSNVLLFLTAWGLDMIPEVMCIKWSLWDCGRRHQARWIAGQHLFVSSIHNLRSPSHLLRSLDTWRLSCHICPIGPNTDLELGWLCCLIYPQSDARTVGGAWRVGVTFGRADVFPCGTCNNSVSSIRSIQVH